MVHAGQINKTTTVPLPNEEDWRQATSEDRDIGYIKRILSIPEETPIDPKELIKKGYAKPFQKGRLELDNGLIYYYYTMHTVRVRQLSLRVVHIKFRQVIMSACHVSTVAVHRHEKITLFRILARFGWTMVNK